MQDPSQLTAAVRRVLLNEAKNHRFDQVPVFCGSSLKNKGVQQLLDAVDALLPSPLDVALPDIFYYVNKELLSIPFEDALHGKASPSAFSILKKETINHVCFQTSVHNPRDDRLCSSISRRIKNQRNSIQYSNEENREGVKVSSYL